MLDAPLPAPAPNLEPAIQRLIAAGLDSYDAHNLLATLAEIASNLGIPLGRINVGSDILDPVLQARQLTWRPTSFQINEYVRSGEHRTKDDWLRSPVRHLLESNAPTLSFPIPSPEAARYPIMQQFAAEGFTGYHAVRLAFGQTEKLGGIEGVLASLCTTAPGGFRPEQIDIINRLMPAFALAYLSLLKTDATIRALKTYLGPTPAKRVLLGSITRNQPETMNAIIWFSDIVSFTKRTEDLPQEAVIEFLNAHAEESVEAVHSHGGEVLKFIGDGILAVFSGGAEGTGNADSALEAALHLHKRLATLAPERQKSGLQTADIAVSLHVGDVLYGNFGSARRLDFTVLGAAVNEASRINTLAARSIARCSPPMCLLIGS